MRRVLTRYQAPLLIVLLLILGGVVGGVASARGSLDHGGPALASTSADPQGALGLAIWLEHMGYRVNRMQSEGATPGAGEALYFVLNPIRPFNATEASATMDWVLRGGTLVVVPMSTFGDSLSSDLGILLRYDADRMNARCFNHLGCIDPSIQPDLAFFTHPAASRFSATGFADLVPRDDNWSPLIVQGIGQKTAILVATRRIGAGHVFAVSDPSLFTNENIGHADNAAIILNILARTTGVKSVAFDEVHHGYPAPTDLVTAGRDAPWGWTVAYVAIVTFLFAAWGGRRFGPAVVPESPPGRSGGEHVAAFAGLLQRQRDAPSWAQRQFLRMIRRGLIRRHGLPTDLGIEDLVRIVSERQGIDPVELGDALRALEGPTLGERAMLTHLRAIDIWLGEKT